MYDAAVIAKNAGAAISNIKKLSDTGLSGGDYEKALRMIECGLCYTYSDGSRNIILKAA